jgi:LacI family transcriptional regulator
MKRIRLTDIANEAGVGSATVERVLNSRGNVRPQTAERVLLAARKLGYDRQLPERYRGLIRLEVILMRPETPFFARLNDAFAGIAATLDRNIVLHRTFLEEKDPLGVARHIANPGFRRSGLIVVAPDHPEVRARLRATKDAGVMVVHMVSRIDGVGDPFIGIDNYAAGRTAAFHMTHMLQPRSGSVLALCHSGAYHAHRERVRGFSDYLSEHANSAYVFPLVMFGLDDRQRSAEVFEDAARTYPDIIGIYNAGGANSGIAAVLERTKRVKSVVWIGHELTDSSCRWLKCGLMDIVLDQAPEVQARRAVDLVLHRLGFLDLEISLEPVRFLTITSENV